MFEGFFEEEQKRIELLDKEKQDKGKQRLDKMRTTSGRWHVRRETWRERTNFFPELRHYFWWVMHNSVAHLFLGFFPCQLTFRFHDWTSSKINANHLQEKNNG